MAQEAVRCLRILLADDDPLTLFTLQQVVTGLGHRVVGRATSGRAVLQQIEVQQPDLILMDIKMPGMNGIEASEKIMAQMPRPIILITAYSDEQTFEQARRAGVAAYLVKPVTDNQLSRAIETVCQRFEAGNQGGILRLD